MLKSKFRAMAVAAAISATAFGGILAFAGPTTKPSTAQPAKRTAPEIVADLQATSAEMMKVASSPRMLLDESKRAEIAPKAIPLMNKMLALFDEYADVMPELKSRRSGYRAQYLPFMIILGDKATIDEVNTQARSVNPEEAKDAKMVLEVADWYRAGKDQAKQTAVLDSMVAMVKADPTGDGVLSLLLMMAGDESATLESKKRIVSIFKNDSKAPNAAQAVEMLEGALKLAEMENKPLTMAAVQLDGKKFSTEDWKGKVILVDFWASWCGPCKAELPRVVKAYKDFHAKGLEVLGVSCDNTPEALKAYLAANPDMAWPQLFDVNTPGWHPLAKSYGIDGIPTMFLIDKKGVLRSVTARESFEEMIPKLLAE